MNDSMQFDFFNNPGFANQGMPNQQPQQFHQNSFMGRIINRINELEQRVNRLDRRVRMLESRKSTYQEQDSFSNTYNTSNYII